MILKLENYNQGRRIVSLALSKDVEDDLMGKQLDAIFLRKNKLFFWKDNEEIWISSENQEKIQNCDNYDIFQIDRMGNAYLFYDNEIIDNAFMLTGKCNSNCIMCPAAESVRKNANSEDMHEMLDIVEHLPNSVRHITITGGEPFLVGKEIFLFFEALKEHCANTDFLLLTNGRALSLNSYAQMLSTYAPKRLITGIPIHGPCAELHDKITRTPGGYEQTMQGIQNLLRYDQRVEIRIVISKQNKDFITDIARLVAERFSNVFSVKIMGMEMTGSAAVNRDKLWIPYSEAFASAREAISLLVNAGINVALYNFPLCSVDTEYRLLCKKSITPNKVKYAEQCDCCNIKDACGGIFAGTYRLAKENIIPIVK